MTWLEAYIALAQLMVIECLRERTPEREPVIILSFEHEEEENA